MNKLMAQREPFFKGLVHRVLSPHTLGLLRYDLQMSFIRLNSRLRRRRWRKMLQGFSNPHSVNIAPGKNGQEGWINLDCSKEEHVTGKFDVRKHLPLPDNSVEMIFCEHFLEHLDFYREVPVFLSECFRVLRKDGVLRVIVPDAAAYFEAYSRPGGPEVMSHLRSTGTYSTKMEVINRVFRQDGQHKFAFDTETLVSVLQRAGFLPSVWSFGRTQKQGLALDKPERAPESVYVEGLKRGASPQA